MWKIYTCKQKIIVVAFISILLGATFIFTIYNGNEEHASLLMNKGFSSGVIVKLVPGSGTNFLDDDIQVRFEIKNVNKIDYQLAVWGVLWDSLIGRSFPLIYDTTSPNINHLLIFPTDFETWNLPFPDSLKWVLKFNKKYKK